MFDQKKKPYPYSQIQLQRFTHTLFINIDIEHILLIVCKLMHKVNYQSKSCLLGLTKAKLEKINHNLNEVWIKAEARNCYLFKWVLIISCIERRSLAECGKCHQIILQRRCPEHLTGGKHFLGMVDYDSRLINTFYG